MSIRWFVFLIVSCGFIWYRFQLQDKEFKIRFPKIFTEQKSDLQDYEINWLRKRKETQRTYALAAIAVVIFSVWMGAWMPYQEKSDREKQHQAFINRFTEGWNYYCDEVFNASISISPNGILYAGSNSFTSDWCQGLIGFKDAEEAYIQDGNGALSEFSDVEYSGRKGLNAGYSKSREAVFSMVPYLCYGTECISNESEQSRLEDLAYQDWKLDNG